MILTGNKIKKLLKDIRTWIVVFILGATAYAAVPQPQDCPITMEGVRKQLVEAQDKHLLEYGKHFQILAHKSGKKPQHQDKKWPDSVCLNDNLSFEVTMHEYVAPDGPGYQIIFEETGTTTSIGHGPEEDLRTFIIIKPVEISNASST